MEAAAWLDAAEAEAAVSPQPAKAQVIIAADSTAANALFVNFIFFILLDASDFRHLSKVMNKRM